MCAASHNSARLPDQIPPMSSPRKTQNVTTTANLNFFWSVFDGYVCAHRHDGRDGRDCDCAQRLLKVVGTLRCAEIKWMSSLIRYSYLVFFSFFSLSSDEVLYLTNRFYPSSLIFVAVTAVVCNVESGAFENQSSTGSDESLHFAIALRAFLNGGGSNALKPLESVIACETFILVCGHIELSSIFFCFANRTPVLCRSEFDSRPLAIVIQVATNEF